MSGLACPVGMLVVTGVAIEPPVEDESNSNTSPRATPASVASPALCKTSRQALQ
jgi:hypothetical protein